MENNEVKITCAEFLRIRSFIMKYRNLCKWIIEKVMHEVDEEFPDMDDQPKFDLIIERLKMMDLPFRWNTWNYPTSKTIQLSIEELGDFHVSMETKYEKSLKK